MNSLKEVYIREVCPEKVEYLATHLRAQPLLIKEATTTLPITARLT